MTIDFNDAPAQSEPNNEPTPTERKLKRLEHELKTVKRHTMYLAKGCPAWLDPDKFVKRKELPLRSSLHIAIGDLRMSIAPDAERYLEDDYWAALDLLCDLAAGMGVGLSTLIPGVMNHYCVSVSDIAQGYMDDRKAYEGD